MQNCIIIDEGLFWSFMGRRRCVIEHQCTSCIQLDKSFKFMMEYHIRKDQE